MLNVYSRLEWSLMRIMWVLSLVPHSVGLLHWSPSKSFAAAKDNRLLRAETQGGCPRSTCHHASLHAGNSWCSFITCPWLLRCCKARLRPNLPEHQGPGRYGKGEGLEGVLAVPQWYPCETKLETEECPRNHRLLALLGPSLQTCSWNMMDSGFW